MEGKVCGKHQTPTLKSFWTKADDRMKLSLEIKFEGGNGKLFFLPDEKFYFFCSLSEKFPDRILVITAKKRTVKIQMILINSKWHESVVSPDKIRNFPSPSQKKVRLFCVWTRPGRLGHFHLVYKFN